MTTTERTTALFLVEDDDRQRATLRMLLEGVSGISIVGEAGSAEEALPAIVELEPDMAIVDIGLPGKSGIELIRSLSERVPDLDIMAHTVFEDRGRVVAALKAGATSYVLKGSSAREIIDAVLELRAGGAPMSPKIARAVVRELQASGGKHDPELLTPREKQVLSAIETGDSYKEIAARLSIGVHTVHSHVKNIYEKLQAHSRRDALEKARRKGFI